MADRFTLNVEVASLQAVEKTLGEIGAQCQEEGAEPAAKPGEATDWSGATASTLKTAMSTLAADMQQAAPHFTDAVTAVSTFRIAAQNAGHIAAVAREFGSPEAGAFSTSFRALDTARLRARTGGPGWAEARHRDACAALERHRDDGLAGSAGELTGAGPGESGR